MSNTKISAVHDPPTKALDSKTARLRKSKKRTPACEIPAPLTLDEIALFKELPILTVGQIARILQKPVRQIYEMSRARCLRPLPVFRSGKTLGSTWDRIIGWREEGFKKR